MRHASWLSPIVLLVLAGTASARDILIYGAPVRRGDFVAGTVE